MPSPAQCNYEFGPFRLEATERRLLRDGKPVPLTAKVFDILLVLVQNHGHLLEKNELMQAVWPDSFVEDGNLTRSVSTLRKALGESDGEYIETVPKRGYRFVAAVREVGGENITVVLRENIHASAVIEEVEREVTGRQAESETGTQRAALSLPASLSRVASHLRLQRPSWPLVSLGVILIGLVLGMSYWWKAGQTELTESGTSVRSIAVLPFKSLGPAGVPGKVGLGFSFDGVDDRIEIPDSASLKPANVTVDAWVRFDALDTPGASAPGLQYIVFKRNSRTSSFEGYALIKLRVGGVDRLQFVISSAAGIQVVTSSATAVASGQFYYAVGSYDGSSAKLYVNGALEDQKAANFPLDYGTRPVFIGSSEESWNGRLNGVVDEVSIYNRALTAAEIQALFNAGSTGKYQPSGLQFDSRTISLPATQNTQSNPAATDYLGLGLADSLITKLSGLGSLIVRPTSTIRQYTNPTLDPLEAGREQKVDAVLDASLQQDGGRLRVSLRLLNVRDGKALWAYQCDEVFCDNLFSMQDVISEQIALALKPRLTGDERRRLRKHYTENREAYEAYGKAVYFWSKRTPEDIRKGIEYFSQAIELDPYYSLAHAGLADSYAVLADYLWCPAKECFPKAKAAALKALELDPNLGEAHASLAQILCLYDWKWAEAEREYRHALELNPGYSYAHQWYGLCLAWQGRFAEAKVELRRALEIDPISLGNNVAYADALYWAREYDQAIAQYRKTLEMYPNWDEGHRRLAEVYEMRGMPEQAIAEYLRQQALLAPRYFFPQRFFRGGVYEIGIYRRALAAAEIQAIAIAGNAGKCKPHCSKHTAGLVGRWPGGGNAQNANDIHPATLLGGTSLTTAKIGQGFGFDSDDDRVTIPHHDDFNVNSPGFTVEFWMKGIKNQPQPYFNLVEKSHSYTDNTGWSIQGTSATGIAVFIIGAGTINFPGVSTSRDVLDGKFHHLAGTWDGVEIRFYVDGILQGTTPLATPANNTRAVNFGFIDAGGGVVARIEAFKKAYAAAGLKGYWRFCWNLLDSPFAPEKDTRERNPMVMHSVAAAYAHVGEKEGALYWLQQAYEAHDKGLVDIKAEPAFDVLRSDPRFSELLHRVGLAP